MENQQLLADLLKHPEKVLPAHASILKEMISKYPYSQPFRALLAKADEDFLTTAALFSNSNALFNIINAKSVENKKDQIELIDAKNEALIDDSDLFEEAKEDENLSTPEMLTAVEIETPHNLPGIDRHLMDISHEEETSSQNMPEEELISFEQIPNQTVPEAPEIETVVPDEPEINYISKYDDDKLPYTFLWWLAKTRKEHEQIFQPYAQPKNQVVNQQSATANKEFQQQYIEHIFHIQTPFEVADHLAEYPTAEIKDAKGAGIIDKFLKEDPIIKPPKPEQIDNENKAKKSAEDHYDLVSETLAKIYIEQMLYHKAIDTYKKLSLKYPEKSRYFADLIQSIEKKL
ncbi:hypothetical protein EZJ43_04930 [Pedobacter changchengzhani]|uniref:Tetratricopeptide repeat protein n=1 Tax=Pedobacter changchengzhani TaxID=2529274 RepID=A0A4R5MNU2_9SPHI|nr:hypothetical protein [Pedobacter changchengzhani]TDG37462.1 hypothetical protein EZJ43_04930 [Pedobacter changchengzhani]